MSRHPELKEGELSKIRSLLVNKTFLAKVAKRVHLGDFLKLGKGEIQSSGRKKDSILADAFEALLAAVYLDSGFDRAYALIQQLFEDFFSAISPSAIYVDYKSRLQELVQATIKTQPEYVIVCENGPDHDKTFEVELSVGDIRTRGKGKSKKAAEQEAAKSALEWLGSRK
jgi:ribonuclease III